MLRRTGFKRKVYVAPPSAPARRLTNPGVITRIGSDVTARPKTEQHRNRNLLDLARGRWCLLRIPGICAGGGDTTVACHSNFSIHGKSGARKADDHWSAWGCGACHTWLDQGPAPHAEKLNYFLAAMELQIPAWFSVTVSGESSATQRSAARWALDLHGS
jgi:hypothetical protein